MAEEEQNESDRPGRGEASPEDFVPEPAPTPEGMAAAARVWALIVGWQDPRMWVLLLGRMMTAIGFSLFFVFLSIYLHTERGVPMKWVGALFLLNGIAGATSKVQGGVLADRWGRRPVMAVALLLRGISILGLAAVTAIQADVIWIAVLVVLSSYVGHFFIPASHAMIADVTSGPKRAEGYGLFRVATNLGWAIGPYVGGYFPSSAYPWVLLITGVTYIITSGVFLRTITETAPKSAAGPVRLGDVDLLRKHRPFLLYCLNITLIYTVMGQLLSTLSAYSVASLRLTTRHVGNLFALNGGLVVILQIPLSRMLQTGRLLPALFIGSLLYAVGYGLVGFAGGFGGLAVAMVVITFGEMLVQPSGLALASHLSPEDKRGRFLGIFGLFNHSGWSIGPLIGGMGLDLFAGTPWVTWLAMSGLAIVAGVLFLALRPILASRLDRPAAPSHEEAVG